MKKGLLATLLSITLIITMMPAMAFAGEGNEQTISHNVYWNIEGPASDAELKIGSSWEDLGINPDDKDKDWLEDHVFTEEDQAPDENGHYGITPWASMIDYAEYHQEPHVFYNINRCEIVGKIHPISAYEWFDKPSVNDHYFFTEIIGLELLDTSNVTTMERMFAFCRKLKSLDLSGFDMTNVDNLVFMFQECNELETIYVSHKNGDWRNIGNSGYLFDACNKLKGGMGTPFIDGPEVIDINFAHIDRGTADPGCFTEKKQQIDSVELTTGRLVEGTKFGAGKPFTDYTAASDHYSVKGAVVLETIGADTDGQPELTIEKEKEYFAVMILEPAAGYTFSSAGISGIQIKVNDKEPDSAVVPGNADNLIVVCRMYGVKGPDPSPTPGPDPSPTPGPGPSPTPSPTPGPSPTPSPTPDPEPTPEPTPDPEPTPQPTPEPDDQVVNGQKVTAGGSVYIVTSAKSKTVAFTKAKNVKTAEVPATIRIQGETYKVVRINANAFKAKKIRTVSVGKNVKTIRANAFKGSKATKLVVRSKKMTKTSVKGSLNRSKIKTVKVKVSKNKKVNRKYAKKYSKIFTKKNAGRKVKVS